MKYLEKLINVFSLFVWNGIHVYNAMGIRCYRIFLYFLSDFIRMFGKLMWNCYFWNEIHNTKLWFFEIYDMLNVWAVFFWFELSNNNKNSAATLWVLKTILSNSYEFLANGVLNGITTSFPTNCTFALALACTTCIGSKSIPKTLWNRCFDNCFS